jgi:hypothetical protein
MVFRGATSEDMLIYNTMKTYRKEIWFEVPSRRAFINITAEGEKCLKESGIKEGLVLVNAMHITAEGRKGYW